MTSILRDTQPANHLSFGPRRRSDSFWPALQWRLSRRGFQIGVYYWIKEGNEFPSTSELTAADDITFRYLSEEQAARLTDAELSKFPKERQKNVQQCVSRGAIIFSAEHSDRVIAFASAYASRAHLFNTTIDLRRDDCYLNYIFVEPAMRGRSIATALRAFRRQCLEKRGFRNFYCFVESRNASSLRNLKKIESETLARIFHIRVGYAFHLMFKIKDYVSRSWSSNFEDMDTVLRARR